MKSAEMLALWRMTFRLTHIRDGGSRAVARRLSESGTGLAMRSWCAVRPTSWSLLSRISARTVPGRSWRIGRAVALNVRCRSTASVRGLHHRSAVAVTHTELRANGLSSVPLVIRPRGDFWPVQHREARPSFHRTQRSTSRLADAFQHVVPSALGSGDP